ncbi:MAG: ABC transporter ATP-binding protein [Alphaproteobacteria bacterium]|nr:ABC transporter ATP-binding protein [Alphaproteobacteria bacterium]
MKQSNYANASMPRSLLKFYFSRCFPGLYKWIILFMILGFLEFSGSVVYPFIERWIVAMFEGAPLGPAIYHHVMPTIALLVGIQMSFSTISILSNHISSVMTPYVNKRISSVLTDYVHLQSMSFWVNRMAGSVNANIRFVNTGAQTLIKDVWAMILRVVMIAINSTLLFTVNKYIAWTFIVMFILRGGFVWALRKKIKKSAEHRAGTESTLSGKLLDGFANQTAVRLFAGEAREHDYLEKPREDHVRAIRTAAFWQRLSWAVPVYFWDTMFGVTLILCAWLYSRDMMKISDIVYSMAVYYNVMGMISNLINRIPDVIDGMSAANKGYKELSVPLEVVDKPDAGALVVKHGKIEFKNVSFKYKNKYVLRDLNLIVKPGERVGIVGASGAGKTTLANLVMRFYDVKHGAILIDGVDIRDITQNSLRENISFIPQDPAMFNRTIRENIAYGRPDASDAEIKRAAKSASADKFIMGTEKKYDTLVGDRGIKMSGGQRQRIAIARAFLKDAPILVLDEATSALDSETEVAIQKSFEKLSHNRTTIAIAHRLSTLRNMDRIVVLDHGAIIESGTHNSLLRRRGAYARLWKMQSGGFLQEDESK